MNIRKEDRKEFINDILLLWDNYYNNPVPPNYPEYLEEDFTRIMKKWERKEKK